MTSRAGSLLLAWLVWAVGMLAWAWRDDELRSSDAHLGYLAFTVVLAVAAGLRVAAASLWPGWGAVAGGLVLTAIGINAVVLMARQLSHWGEIVDPTPERLAWVPWDSLAGLPFTLALPAGLVLLVGGIAAARRRGPGATYPPPRASASA